ncbi:MAG: VWA domain-containing protein [Oscillospiraceae bacterium]|jgi:Ca-activated chloride channel family protein|nr:VWA domain-containing protein [Oscillospiraceae bacterium]
MKLFKNNVVKLGAIAVIVFGLIFAAVSLTQNWGKTKDTVNTEQSVKKLKQLYSKLNVNSLTPQMDEEYSADEQSASVLPDISEYPFVVNPTTDDFLTIYSSPEKAGSGYESWLVDVANKFNQSGVQVNGKPVSVGIRSVSSGLAASFISSGKYTPDVLAPSNELWGILLSAKGIKVTTVEKRIAGNVAGVVISKKKNDELNQKYGAVNGKTIIDAVINNEIKLAYTDPYASSSGLNFLLMALSIFDSSNPTGEAAVAQFQKFQQNIAFTAYNTMQMKESAQGGALDAFLLEYQTFLNSPELKNAYEFIPFGVRHDQPVYEIGELTSVKKQITAEFVKYCKTAESQSLATEKGFNGHDEYAYELSKLDGETIVKAQGVWKSEKSGGSALTAVFVADISGSMEGSPLLKLKASLNQAMNFIGSDTNVGFVTFSDNVDIALPIAKFDNTQKSYFSKAVKNLRAGGATAMFDAVIVAQKMLIEEQEKNPGTKLMLFVLTDGETNRGYEFNDIEKLTRGTKIPIYTIGYNANIDVLQQLSNINEAATMNAENDNIIYRLESLFNTQM